MNQEDFWISGVDESYKGEIASVIEKLLTSFGVPVLPQDIDIIEDDVEVIIESDTEPETQEGTEAEEHVEIPTDQPDQSDQYGDSILSVDDLDPIFDNNQSTKGYIFSYDKSRTPMWLKII